MMFEVGAEVWSVYHPAVGYLSKPFRDTVKEVMDVPEGRMYLLSQCNSLDDPLFNHWSNDFYGNLVDSSKIFCTEAAAKQILIKHYNKQRSLLINNLKKIEKILENLNA